MKKNDFERPQISQVEDLTVKLALANRKLKEAENNRSKLLANISHDLRAPMTAIRSCIDYLVSLSNEPHPDFNECRDTLRILDRRSQNLEKLINDLYYLVSIDIQAMVFNFEEIDLSSFLEEYFFSVEADKNFDEHKLCLDVPENMKISVSIDAQRIVRVLDNLFANARKYSNAGAEIHLNAYSYNEEMVCVTVSDTGMGISKESMKYIFERSYTVSSSRTPYNSGTGLGLAIARGIVENHGGQIWCESVLGEGSTFFFTIPIHR